MIGPRALLRISHHCQSGEVAAMLAVAEPPMRFFSVWRQRLILPWIWGWHVAPPVLSMPSSESHRQGRTVPTRLQSRAKTSTAMPSNCICYWIIISPPWISTAAPVM